VKARVSRASIIKPNANHLIESIGNFFILPPLSNNIVIVVIKLVETGRNLRTGLDP
jgi:hypothetical protein